MSTIRPFTVAIKLTLSVSLVVALGGCSYDYFQRTDRVAYSAGNAVKANLESETTNPSSKASYNKSGLGKEGPVTGPTDSSGGASSP